MIIPLCQDLSSLFTYFIGIVTQTDKGQLFYSSAVVTVLCSETEDHFFHFILKLNEAQLINFVIFYTNTEGLKCV